MEITITFQCNMQWETFLVVEVHPLLLILVISTQITNTYEVIMVHPLLMVDLMAQEGLLPARMDLHQLVMDLHQVVMDLH